MNDDTPHRGPALDRRGRPVDWKLLFNQLFALELRKEHVLPVSPRAPEELFDRLLRAYTQYAPGTFNDAIDAITSVESSDEAYEARLAFYENPANRKLIAAADFSASVGEDLREIPAVARFLGEIERHRDRPIEAGEHFLDSPEGRSLVRAFRVDGGVNDQEVALVLVPGFAGHTIKFNLFEEMVSDINETYGRPAERPMLREEGLDLEPEGHTVFYGRHNRRRNHFDILQPVGSELGNTTGSNDEMVELIGQWIDTLPARYERKKLILMGYSKGAPIVLELVRRRPELASRVLGYVTFLGVVQGTNIARGALEQAESLLRDVPVGTFIDQLRGEKRAQLATVLSPLFSDVDLSWLSLPRIRAVFDVLGQDIAPIERQIDRALVGRELREVLDGARDLSPLARTRWNLAHLDDDTFREPVWVMSLSALTDVRDFVRPPGLGPEGPAVQSLLAPALTPSGDLDWRQLSLDALFLYLTSIDGFKTAPGGLFDTQVDLGATKLPLIDRRPLSASLTTAELEALWADEALRALLRRNGVRLLEELANRPRCDLIPPERCSNLDAIDLGEFKGHHWSTFAQALRPPPELSREHAVWEFPRKAFMRALLQVLAFRNLIEHASPPELTGAAGADGGRARNLPSIPPDDSEYRDVVLVRTEGDEPGQQGLFNLYNLGARAVAYGLVVNSARTGLGTATPVGRQLASESLYYQGLRVYSYFDWEARRALLSDPSIWPLPQTITLVAGRFHRDFAASFPEEPIERLDTVRKALKVLTPQLKPFELRRLGPAHLVGKSGARVVIFSSAIRDNLWRGTRAKLTSIARDACSTETADVQTKILAMLGAFTPLCSVFAASFDREKPDRSRTRLTLYLPAFHTLHAEDLDRPRTWYLEKGLKDLQLPRPVQLAQAEITHLRYLQDADPGRDQAIKVELRRDFDGRDRVTSVVSFGTMFTGPAEELFAFDASDHRDALHVVFRPKFFAVDGDSPADRAFKEAFNRVFGAFEIEARLHQLTLHYRRRATGTQEDAVLRPRFSLQESRISFRVHRTVETAVERLPMLAAGFTCEPEKGTQRFHCTRDFWTWDHLLQEFFAGRALGGGRIRLPTYFRERLVEQLVGTATQAVVDRSIAAIEDAIDQEVSRIVDDSLKRYARAREVLIDRLHEGLF